MGIKIERLVDKEAVYDITVEGNENFFANDILVHNCAEIALPTTPLEHADSGAPEKKLIRMTPAEYEKYKVWKINNKNTPLKRVYNV